MNKEKLKNLIHYICHKVRDPSRLGKTNLNKVLYFSDFLFYLHHYEPITGETYIKKEHGPVAKHLNQVLQELESHDKVFQREQSVIDFTRHELVSKKKPDISDFTGEQIALVDTVIDMTLKGQTKGLAHRLGQDKVWNMAHPGEEIPYFTILGKDSAPSEKAIRWARDMIEQKYGVTA